MVSVEPPETTWPLLSACQPARSSACGSTPPMLVEALVLIGDEHVEEARIDIVGGHRQAPVAIMGDEGPQQLAVAVGHQRRIGDVFAQRQRPQPPQGFGDGEADGVESESQAKSSPA